MSQFPRVPKREHHDQTPDNAYEVDVTDSWASWSCGYKGCRVTGNERTQKAANRAAADHRDGCPKRPA